MIHPSATIDDFSIVNAKFVGEHTRISSCVRIEEECVIHDHCFIGHGVVMRPHTYIEHSVVVGHHTVFEGRCAIGEGTLIQAQSNITRGAVIGKKVFIGMQFCGGNDNRIIHARQSYYGVFTPNAYKIEDFARIGFGVRVLPGVVIGKNAFVAAGSLVTKDVPAYMKVKGSPAKVYGKVPEYEWL